jgi:hypothetical protein
MSGAIWPMLTFDSNRFGGKSYDAYNFDHAFFAKLADILKLAQTDDIIVQIRKEHFVAFSAYFFAARRKANEKTPREENSQLEKVRKHAEELSLALKTLKRTGLAHQRMYRSAINHDDKARLGGVNLQDLLGHPQVHTFELITDLLFDIKRTAQRAIDHRYPIADGPLRDGEQVDDFGTPQTYALDLFVYRFRGLIENITDLDFTEGKYPLRIEDKAEVSTIIRAISFCLEKQGTPKTFDQIHYAVKRCREGKFTYVE